ncbi:hypothetical protein [Anaerovibrio lipolyticus]|uniref:hypothetical protein n=1 Tax=Anaerovibrio lipolyticus TaxID=82374 RepID=UPI0026F0C077|nr:hypothetical protein [Anaerovibrio lipolyticus]MBE6105351.1 hypothetical protein [Anaerovibrio lipolyticus]
MKFKDENKLTDGELEQVAGGNSNLSDDSRFLNVLLRGREGHCGRYGDWKSGDHYDEIVKAWKSVGVDFEDGVILDCAEIITYRINGQEVSQLQAWLHAEQVVGKHLKRADWDW